LKLIDFGFSAQIRLRKWGKLDDNVGTTLFMAPEQIERQSYGKVGVGGLSF